MKIVAILNPAAGGGRGAARAEAALRKLPNVRLLRSKAPSEASALAASASQQGADIVIACGGDGTVFEVAGGLLSSGEPQSALAVLPVGTGNSFVRDLGIRDESSAIEAIKANHRRRSDVLAVTHTGGQLYSLNLVSLGFSAVVGELTNRRFKPLGTTGYVGAVLASLIRLRHHVVPFSIDGGPYDSRPLTLLSFCNSRYTGGAMMMAPHASIEDGLLDIVRIGPMNRRRFLSCFPKIFRGTHPLMPEVQIHRAQRAEFAPTGPLPVMIDGEIQILEVRKIEVRPRALEIIFRPQEET